MLCLSIFFTGGVSISGREMKHSYVDSGTKDFLKDVGGQRSLSFSSVIF